MTYLYFKKHVFVLLVYNVFLLMTSFLYAQKSVPENNLDTFKKGFYVGFETGVGWLKLTSDTIDESRNDRFILAFNVGYRPFRALRVGMQLGGYLIETGDNSDPSKGIGISNTSLQVQVFPFKTVPLFANIQYGWSTYSNNNYHGRNSNGTSQKIGLGYEYNLNKHFALSLISNYSFGKFNDVDDAIVTIHNRKYDSWDITLCLTYK